MKTPSNPATFEQDRQAGEANFCRKKFLGLTKKLLHFSL